MTTTMMMKTEKRHTKPLLRRGKGNETPQAHIKAGTARLLHRLND
jgi:hypothetical protein